MRIRDLGLYMALLVIGAAACGGNAAGEVSEATIPQDEGEAIASEAEGLPEGREAMNLQSPAFEPEDLIPARYSCDGEDISPELNWSGAPPETASFVLIADDPDAPAGTWVHWVLYDLPPSLSGLPEAVPAVESLDGGGTHGENSWRRLGYGGPCPPGGTHRYFFKLYALDSVLGLPPGATKAEVLQAIEGRVLGQTELMGRYSRN